MSNPIHLPINPATATEEELESFRRQWREEVTARSRQPHSSSAAHQSTHSHSSKPHASQRNKAPAFSEKPRDAHDEHDEAEPHTYHDLGEKQFGRRLADPAPANNKTPVSALEHYEEAVNRETQGKLGDSLNLYRKAFKVCGILSVILASFLTRIAVRRSRPGDLQEETLSRSSPETCKLKSVQRICHRSKHCPPLPRRRLFQHH